MPKLKNGYTKIANEIMSEFAKIRISGQARQVLDFILRKTYGWNKVKDSISLSQFTEGTGMKKTTVIRALYKLIQMNLIGKEKQINKEDANTYWFNKHSETWKPLPKKIITHIRKSSLRRFCYICGYKKVVHKHHITPLSKGGADRVSNIAMLCPNCHALVHKGEFSKEFLITKKDNAEFITKKDNALSEKVKKALPKKVHTKETITKETITKEKDLVQKFNLFWEMYDLKKSRPDCEDYWFGRKKLKNKLLMTEKMMDIILITLPSYVQNTNKNDVYPTRKNPRTYLYNSSWLDEVVKKSKTKKDAENELRQAKNEKLKEVDKLYLEYKETASDDFKLQILKLIKIEKETWENLTEESREKYKHIIVKFYKRIVLEGIKPEFAHFKSGSENELK